MALAKDNNALDAMRSTRPKKKPKEFAKRLLKNSMAVEQCLGNLA